MVSYKFSFLIFYSLSYTNLLSSLIWYPTVCPIFSPLSAATLSAMVNAEILRGCVQKILHGLPLAWLSSSIICGIWEKKTQKTSSRIEIHI